MLSICKEHAAVSVTTNKMSSMLLLEDNVAVSLNTSRADFEDALQQLADNVVHHASVVVDQELLKLGAEQFMCMLPSCI